MITVSNGELMVSTIALILLGGASMWCIMSERLYWMCMDRDADLRDLHRRVEQSLTCLRAASKAHGENDGVRRARWQMVGIAELLERRVQGTGEWPVQRDSTEGRVK